MPRVDRARRQRSSPWLPRPEGRRPESSAMAQSQVVPVDAKPVVAAAPPPVPSGLRRFPLNATVCVWAALALATAVLARQNGSVPGLYYDEACLAGGAKEFVTGQTRGRHMPWYLAVDVLGRPFPLFFQSYSGALKGWMLIPVFAVFGSSLVALRWASLGWTLLALLVFMLWVRRWQGDRVAITAGVLLGLDPSWFFIGVLWGPLIGSFLSRCVCFYLTLRWFREGKLRYAFFAALAAGLGFFNKVDFVVLLAGASAAAVACYWR